MKSIIQINTRLINSIVEEKEFSNDIPFSRNILIEPTLKTDLAVNYIKNIISNNSIEDGSTLKRIIESVKIFQIKEQKNSLVKILNMRNNESFIDISNNFDIDDSTKKQNYSLLFTLDVPSTSHAISTLLYEIVKFSKEFPDYSITKIKYPQGSTLEVINIPK